MSTGNKSEPNPDEIYVPDPGHNVIVYNGECYSRTDGRGPIDTLIKAPPPHYGYNTCIECLHVNPTPTPTPTLTYPAPAAAGFPYDISSHIEGATAVVEVHRLSGFGIAFEVDYEITPLSAVENVDYSLPEGDSGTLKFSATDNIQYIRIDLELDHELVELDELIHINLTEARVLQSRARAEIAVGKELRIIQIQESGIPPATSLSAGDIFDVAETTLNIKFDADTGQDAVINLYPDYANDPNTYFEITVANDGGNFVWDKNDIVSSYKSFDANTFPVAWSFDVYYIAAGKDITYTITYLGPGSFYFNVECPPVPTPLPGGSS